jgi:hypothetical protein
MSGALFAGQETTRYMDAELEQVGTPDEMTELAGILVRECGCGCAYRDGELVSAARDCAATQALHDRRFVLGMFFGRRLRRRLEAEERTRTRLRPQSGRK